MASSEITVNPQRLRQAAQELDKVYGTYRSNMEQAGTETQKLRDVWTGPAATAYYTSFEGIKKNCENYLQTLSKTIKALYDTADAYERSEKEITDAAENLPKLPSNTMR